METQGHHNQDTNHKRAFKPVVVTVALALMLLFGNSFELFAQAPTSTGADQGAAPEGAENIVCQAEMFKFIDAESKIYKAWMEQHFQNKSSTGSLLDDAVARYGQYRDAAYKKYFTFFPHQGALQLTEGLEAPACRKMMEDELASARRLIESKARSTSAVKKTTALITKYQQINAQLRALNQTFVTTKSLITTFSDKLPCYIRKSCNKG